jgi:hypothetical protein
VLMALQPTHANVQTTSMEQTVNMVSMGVHGVYFGNVAI